jgi:hypothetical protein
MQLPRLVQYVTQEPPQFGARGYSASLVINDDEDARTPAPALELLK